MGDAEEAGSSRYNRTDARSHKDTVITHIRPAQVQANRIPVLGGESEHRVSPLTKKLYPINIGLQRKKISMEITTLQGRPSNF